MVKLEIKTDNAAFQGRHGFEVGVGRILRRLAEKIENGEKGAIALMDINGNRVGTARVTR